MMDRTANMGRVADAVAFALKCHEGQEYQRKEGAWPYAVHSICVALRMKHPVGQIVALLHDVVEDRGVSLEEIEKRFGPTVMVHVRTLTRRDDETYAEYLERVKELPLAVKVKSADLRENLDKCVAWNAPDFARSLIERYSKALLFLEGGNDG